MVYRGQKLTKLVKTKTPARIQSTNPSVPGINPFQYNIPITAAIITLVTLSALPIFFFIIAYFKYSIINTIVVVIPIHSRQTSNSF